jgi:autotransporter-associated beta strand protein
MKKNHSRLSLMLMLFATTAVVLTQGRAFGQVNTWTATSGAWSNGANWSGGLPDLVSGTASLAFGNNANWTSTLDAPALANLNSLSFAGTGNGKINGGTTIDFSGPSPSITVNLANSSGSVQIADAMQVASGTLNVTVTKGNLFLGDVGTAYWFTGGTGSITIYNNTSNTVLCGDLGHLNSGPGLNYFTVAAGRVQCSDGPNGGGDVFGNFTVLNVLAGATYDFNTNAETMGAIQGAGNITGENGISPQIPGNFTVSGSISGPGTITQGVVGTLTLAGSNNFGALTGSVAGAQFHLANPSASGSGTVTVTSAPNGLVFDTNRGAFSNFNLAGLAGAGNVAALTDINGYTANVTIGSNNASTSFSLLWGKGGVTKIGTGTLTLMGPSAYSGATTVSAGYLKTNAMAISSGSVTLSGGTLELDGSIPNINPTLFSAGANTTLIRNGGSGVITLSGTNKFGGSSLQLYSGGLMMDDTANNSLKLSGTSAPALTLGSGPLGLIGNGGTNSVESVGGVSLLGAGEVSVTAGSNGNATLNLNGVSYNSGSALNVTLNNNGSGVAAVTTTTSASRIVNGTTMILGGNVVVNGMDWATTTGSGTLNIAAVPSSAYTVNGAWTSASLNSVTQNTVLAPSSTTAALRLNNGGTGPLTLTLGGINSITTGGLLVTSNPNNAVTITGGTIAQPADTPLYVGQYNTASPLNIASTLQDTVVTLTPTATFSSGATTITMPTAGLYPGMAVSGPGIATGTQVLSINASNALTLTKATIAAVGASATTFIGGTPLVKSGPGVLVLSATNNLTGGIILNEGTLSISSPSALGAATNPIIFNGGTLYPVGIGLNAGTNPWFLNFTGGTVNVDPRQTVSRNGTDILGTGSLTLNGSGTLALGSAASTMTGQVYVNQGILQMTGSRLGAAQGITIAPGAQFNIADNGTATYSMNSAAVLSLSGSGAGDTGAFALTVAAAGAAPKSTFSNPIYLAGNTLFTQTTGTMATSGVATLILSGPIAGPGALIKGGDGVLQINASYNNFGGAAGTTTVLNGTLRIGALNSLPTTTTLVLGDSTANTSGVFDLNNQSQTLASLVNVQNSHVTSSSGSAGVLTLNYQGSTPLVYNGGMTGNFALAVTGSGIVTLAGANSYTEGTMIAAGSTLQLGNNGVGSGSAGNVVNSGLLSFAGGIAAGGISGTGSVAVVQQAQISMTAGQNIYTGPTNIQNGMIVASGGGSAVNPLPAGTSVVLGSGSNSGVLQLGDEYGPASQTIAALSSQGTGSGNAVNGVSFNGVSTLILNQGSNTTFNGSLGSNLALVIAGSGKLSLSGTGAYGGPTTINSGVLEALSAAAFSPNSAYTINSPGILRVSGNSVSVGSIQGSGTIENANAAAGTLVTGFDNTSTIFSGLLRNGTGGVLNLTKVGNGMLTLPVSTAYTGLTSVNGGTLQLIGGSSQASSYAIANGAALNVSTSANSAAIGSSLTLGAQAGDAMTLNFSTQGAWSQTAPMLTVAGPITTAGMTSLNLSSFWNPPVGLYPLIGYSGSIGGSGSSALSIGALPTGRMVATLQKDPSHNWIDLDVTYADSPKWTGAVSGNWNTTDKNWALVVAGSATTYMNRDNVLFDDSAAGTTVVNVDSPVTPNYVTFNNSVLPYTLTGAAITGPGGLGLTGSGLVVLANDNTYAGVTTISAGTLQLGNGGTTGSVTSNIADSGTLVFQHSDNPTYAGVISGSGGLVQNGAGSLTLIGSDTYSGLTTIASGTLQVGAGGNSGMIAGGVSNQGTLAFSRSDTAVYNGAISGAGAVVQDGPGVLVFNGNHTYTGLTTVSAGTLQIGSGGNTGSLVANVAFPAAGNGTGTLSFARSDTTTYSGSASGAGSLVQLGPGNLILTGTNTHTQGTVFSGGTITVASDSALGAPSGQLIFLNGTLLASAPLDIGANRPIYPDGPAATINTNGFNVTLDAQIMPGLNGSIVKNGAGTLTLTNPNNFYTGNPPNPGSTFSINSGVVSIAENTQMPTRLVALNGGALQFTAQMGAGWPPTTAIGSEFTTNISVGASGGTIDCGGNWVATYGAITGNVGTNLTVSSGTLCPIIGLGGSGYNGNVHILSGATIIDSNSYLPGANTDAFGNSTVVTIDAGGVWDDSWGNGEDMGGIAGGGDIYERVGYGLTMYANVSTTFSGRILAASTTPTSSVPTTWALAPGGNVPFTQYSGNSITLTSTGSTFGGVTTIDNGTIVVSANVLPNQTGPLGMASSPILVGNTTGTSNASLLSDTAGVQIGRSVQLQSGNSGVMTVGGINTSGTVTYTGNIVLGSPSSAAVPLTVTAAPGGTVVFVAPIGRAAGATGSSDSITLVGGGTVVFAGANNNYLGPTLIQNGTLVAAAGVNTLPATTAVTLGDTSNDSGILQLGSAGGAVYQTVAGLSTANSGSGNAVVGGNASAMSTLAVNLTSTAATAFAGTLGGATPTQNNLNFALAGSGQLVLSGANKYTGTTTVSGGTLVAGSTSAFGVNSALSVASGAATFLAGNDLTIGSLAGNGVVANLGISPAQLTVGADNTSTLFAGVLQNGSMAALALQKIGTGSLTIAGAQTYTGATSIAGGLLQLQGGASLASGVTVNGGAALGVLETGAMATASLGSTLTFGTSATDTSALDFTLQSPWSAGTPLLSASGMVTATGTTNINISSVYMPSVGNYTLLQGSSSLAGQGFSGFKLGSLPSQQMTALLVTDSGSDSLILEVTSIDRLRWTGAQSNAWDNATTNWQTFSTSAALVFAAGNNVLFDDTGANTAITLSSAVAPSNVLFNNNAQAYSISGPGKVTGSTGLLMTGSGLVTLNTNNDYQGGTFINGGTLQLGSGGATGSIQGNVVNNSLLVFNRSDAPVFSGVISGSGAVSQAGGGMLTLLGNNTYTGLTTVSAGTLQLGNGGASGAVAGNILNNATVIFNRVDTPVYAGSIGGNGTIVSQGAGTIVLSGPISGGQSLVQQGLGTTVLAGSNTYTGGTAIKSGVLQIGNGGSTGSIAGNVADNATLSFNRSNQTTYSGAISGAGSLVQAGVGMVTLTGSNTYSGGTTISSGILQLAKSGSIVGTVLIGGVLSVNEPGSVSLSGSLTGNGSVQQQGAGVTTMSGTNSYLGGTTITGGMVSISNYQNLGAGPITLNGGGLQITANMGNPNNPNTANGTDLVNAISVGASGGTLNIGSNWFSTVTGAITGSGPLTLAGSGVWYCRYGLGGSGFLGNLNISGGTLLDDSNNATGGNTDAISNNTIVNVSAGAAWDDSWGNGEAMGGFAGAGNVLIAIGYGNSFSTSANVKNLVFSGELRAATNSVVVPGGNASLTQSSGGTLTMTNPNSDYGGTTSVTDGVIVVSANVLPNQPGPLGQANSAITVGGASNSSLFINVAGVQIGRPITIASGAGAATLGGANNSGTVYYTGPITLGTSTTVPLTVASTNGGTVEIDGTIQDGSGLNGSTDSLIVGGSGTVVLTANNTYGGNGGNTTLMPGTTLVIANTAGGGSATGYGQVVLSGGTLAAANTALGGGTIYGPVQGGSALHTIAPGATLPAGQYGLLNLYGGLTTNANTTLTFNMNLGAVLGTDPGGNNIYGGDLINLANSSLTVQGGQINFGVNPQFCGDYRLLGNLGNTTNATGFNLPTPPAGDSYSLSTAADAGYLDLVVTTTAAAWYGTGGTASWSPGNWNVSPAPTSGTLIFAGSPSAPNTILLDGNQSGGSLVFNVPGSNGYTLSQGSGGVLTLGTTAGSIVVVTGSDTISAPLSLAGNLSVAPSAGTTLAINGNISQANLGTSLALNAPGTLILSGSNGYTGGTIVEQGTLLIASNNALVDGTSLTVGGGGGSLFTSALPEVVVTPMAGAVSGVAAVPEPETMALLAVALGGAAVCRLRVRCRIRRAAR